MDEVLLGQPIMTVLQSDLIWLVKRASEDEVKAFSSRDVAIGYALGEIPATVYEVSLVSEVHR